MLAHARIMNSGVIKFSAHDFKQYVGINVCRKLKCRIWRSDLWHNVHTKYHEYPSSLSLVIKYVQTDTDSWRLG